jgi:hypothetical protein
MLLKESQYVIFQVWMKLQKADLKRITKLFIKQKNFNHGIQPWVRNLHMEILMLLTIKPRIQRQLNSGLVPVA